jgi:rod shape-determining protein MreC
MQRLINIILLFKEYFILAGLVIASFILLYSNNNSQIHAIRSYTVGMIGFVQNTLSIVPNVFELKRDNEVLRKLAVNLSDEVNRLREARLENLRLRSLIGLKERTSFTLAAGDIVGKNMHLLRNTITLNVGENDGVHPDMPIICETGLVGKIIAASGNFSVGLIMFNKDFRASAKIQRTRIDGIIAWDGGATLLLTNIPKTQDVKEGDIVITSEYSKIFPPEVKIGVVLKVGEKEGNLFKDIEVAPSVDFSSLEQVFVVTTIADSEKTALENSAQKSK